MGSRAVFVVQVTRMNRGFSMQDEIVDLEHRSWE